ncbi:MAG: hypothetical protein FD180_854 [Planctomycetota bacterium]|nr:MAG: hypothetical protein FD180_854 [Planctomycetota bacterium]
MTESFGLFESVVPLTSTARMLLLAFAAGVSALCGAIIEPLTPLRLPRILGTPHRER